MTGRLGRLHWPRVYRYRVADGPPRHRAGWNTYPGRVIGAYIVVGRFTYCVKWGAAS
jgi:hypothetical protein